VDQLQTSANNAGNAMTQSRDETETAINVSQDADVRLNEVLTNEQNETSEEISNVWNLHLR